MCARNGRVGERTSGIKRNRRIERRVSIAVPIIGGPCLIGRTSDGTIEIQLSRVAAFAGKESGVVRRLGQSYGVIGDLGIGDRGIAIVRSGAHVDTNRPVSSNTGTVHV